MTRIQALVLVSLAALAPRIEAMQAMQRTLEDRANRCHGDDRQAKRLSAMLRQLPARGNPVWSRSVPERLAALFSRRGKRHDDRQR